MQSLFHLAERIRGWWQVAEPVTFDDAVRFSVMYGLIIAGYALTQAVLGNAVWFAFLVLIIPAMAAFAAGFAVRSGSRRRTLGSLAIGLLGGGLPLALPAVRNQVIAVGPVGILLLWLLVLIGLFGYAFPDYASAMRSQTGG